MPRDPRNELSTAEKAEYGTSLVRGIVSMLVRLEKKYPAIATLLATEIEEEPMSLEELDEVHNELEDLVGPDTNHPYKPVRYTL